MMPIETNRTTRLGLLSRRTLLLWSAAIVAAILAAPLIASAGRAEGWFLYQAFDIVCHQQPERSWRVQSLPTAVCVRCFGFYAGLLLAALLGLRLPVKFVTAALFLAGLSWIAEAAGFAVAPDGIRFLTGLGLGASICAAILGITAAPRAHSAKACGEHAIP